MSKKRSGVWQSDSIYVSQVEVCYACCWALELTLVTVS